jgi:hypothetical protein
MWVKYTVTDLRFSLPFFFFFFLFRRSKTAIRNGIGCMMAQKTWFCVSMCFVSVRSATVDVKEFNISENCSSLEIPAKTETSENVE